MQRLSKYLIYNDMLHWLPFNTVYEAYTYDVLSLSPNKYKEYAELTVPLSKLTMLRKLDI